MPDYNDIPNPWPIAKDKYDIPDWFTNITITDNWINFYDEVTIDQERTEILIEKSYTHENDKCYEIQEYVIYEWHKTTRYGTLQKILHVEMGELIRARRNALLFLTRAMQGSLADYMDPTTTTAGGLIDVAVAFAGLPVAEIFGPLAQAMSLSQLLDDVSEIADKVRLALEAIERLIAANNKVIEEYKNVVWAFSWQKIKAYSSVESIIEVECVDWILELKEGAVIYIPEWDEWIYPPQPVPDPIDEELRRIREELGNVKSRGEGKVNKMIRDLKKEYQKKDEQKK